jgi:serine/threonine protein kinase
MSEATSETPSELFAGTQYQNPRRLDIGGMGEIYLVDHRYLHRTFVAKILHATFMSYPQVIDRMRLEAQALGQLDHPNVVSAVGFGTSADGRPFLVLEHLEGRTLRAELAERGTLPLGEALCHTLGLLEGLRAAHALGVVHRDIKPDNLFLETPRNGGRVLKILDFGIARVLPGAPPAAPRPLSLPTESGAVIGTPRFLSPEAAVGGRVDTRADLYGAALVLYTMLAGRGPFDHAPDREDLLEAHASEAPAPPSHYATQALPGDLDELLLIALAKDPAARFQTAEAFGSALMHVAKSAGVTLAPPEHTSLAFRPQGPPSVGQRTSVALASLPPVPSDVPSGAPLASMGPAAAAPRPSTGGSSLRPALPKPLSRAVLALVFVLSALASAAVAAGLVALLTGP